MCKGRIKAQMGNPKQQSRFICLHCLKENCVGAGIQRLRQREKGHIKDMMCINKGCEGMTTKNIEVRYCDDFQTAMRKAERLHKKFYTQDNPVDNIEE